MRDRVLTNRCVMDSILWFHLECPKAVAKFDDPVEFKRKFRDFLADTRSAAEHVNYQSESAKRVKAEYEHMQYPEDIREHKEFRQFEDEFREFSPVIKPEPEEEFDNEDLPDNFEVDPKAVKYGQVPEILKTRPISREDAAKPE